MESEMDFHTARALLEWQVELGADEAIGDAPVDRYALAAKPPKPAAAPAVPVAGPVPPAHAGDPVAEARRAAEGAADLGALKAAMAAYQHCDLKLGARQLVFSDGHPEARVMIVGEAPGRDEDRLGKPFVGRAGQFLDRMLAAIGLDRGSDDPERAVYITNVLPWRPPQNRDPSAEEIAMMLPFVSRHVALVKPRVVVLMGNISCEAALGRKGITRLRGTWTEAYGTPALPMFHPAYLLRQPLAKREAWADLLSLQARLRAPA
ncbi:uracil-DNA glycosylase [Roseovarius sp. SCSIO 43702]|uniref:uracil-DNA glycosylase n=1 Tax=Roseovarius sp. SCSIO 43702 TaxID=2823043 RepID=UPI001C73174C|nr:uracil-DNA glycosylase [Roseovarius sp. SCSIO 43702]QYX57463.1 uracil-DNA glycosylase [Roseovarius sp. SCSIO 43702]